MCPARHLGGHQCGGVDPRGSGRRCDQHVDADGHADAGSDVNSNQHADRHEYAAGVAHIDIDRDGHADTRADWHEHLHGYPDDVPGGHAFTQTNGFGGAGNLGYTVVDDADASFWTEFQRLGGVDIVGYPIANRVQYRGFLIQPFQKLVLQWRPDLGGAVPVNVLDDIIQQGGDAWLAVDRQVPRGQSFADTGLEWPAVVANHVAILDAYPALHDYYASQPDAVDRFGLPLGVDTYGPLVSVRLQRATLQLWTVDAPWAPAGTVVVGNGGDLGKQAGLWPLDADPPVAVQAPD
ncbi:MAG TPA: hypothetical protein VKV73_32365 [Chloroflexota bacterium]|nr:hypothetical protein [Chloroflexota bacterium]